MKRVALVTGSANGMGVQTVLHLARQGHDIAMTYLTSMEKANQLKQTIEKIGVRCELIQGDVTKAEDCQRMAAESMEIFGSVDILVNNVGPYIFEYKKLVDYSVEEWNLMIHGNLSSVFYLTKELIPNMRKNRWGRIINFGFTGSAHASGWMYRSAYAAAKVGLTSLTRSLAQEESEYGITVNMICPGDIVDPYKDQAITRNNNLTHTAPIGRPGTGEDIARIVAFLITENSDFISGSIIDVNGGLTLEAMLKNHEN